MTELAITLPWWAITGMVLWALLTPLLTVLLLWVIGGIVDVPEQPYPRGSFGDDDEGAAAYFGTGAPPEAYREARERTVAAFDLAERQQADERERYREAALGVRDDRR